ncbi:MAG: outer membrane lipoprotein-sorting protein, partial [Deltaproteobacteria bacterium]|nr:outer membrane lipoprotein-sorting protein [Deltaproteobacteria bacterium]
WMYWPRFRKVTRLQADQRDDTVDGTDQINDDEIGYDGRINKNTYKMLGRKKLLLCRHQNKEKFERIPGMVMISGLQRELSNLYVVEVKTNVPGYVYSKQIWYLDPETWVINYKEMYDLQGRLWKFYENYQSMIKGRPEQGTIPVQHGSTIVDLIRRHGSPGHEREVLCGTDIPLNQFSIRALEKRAY